jgi:hypothetical protein
MSTADALALLDVEGSERFALSVHHDGLVPATDLPHETVVQCLQNPRVFLATVAGDRRMPFREIVRLQASWRVQQGLIDGDGLARLLWIVGTFSSELEVDLLQHVGVSLGDLWRRRQWRLLLNLIDHLPRATWSWQAMANHPEYAERIAGQVAARRLLADPDEGPSPSLVEHTPEVAALTSVIDAINALRVTVMQANTPSGKSIPKIPPYPRPRTLIDSMIDSKERMQRWAKHEELANRLLPHRRGD